jgi:hypothetical protein
LAGLGVKEDVGYELLDDVFGDSGPIEE